MLKKLLLGLFGAAALATVVLASPQAPLPNFTSAATNEPSQINATLNTMNQNINNGVSGNVLTQAGSVVTSGTTAFTFDTYTLPANFMNAGQILHARMWGVNSADANAKTITFNFGGTSCAVIVTGSGNTWFAEFNLQISAVGASPTQTNMCYGQTAATPVTLVAQAGQTVATGSAVTVTLTGTAAVSGTITAQGAFIEILR